MNPLISHTVNANNNSFYTKGALFDVDNVKLGKQKFSVYDRDQNFLGTGKTTAEGTFNTRLSPRPNLTNLDQTADLVFRLVVERKDPVSKFKHRSETQQGIIREVKINSNSLDLGNIKMDEVFTSEQFPLSYIRDLGTTAIPAIAIGLKEDIEQLVHTYTREEAIDKIQQDHDVIPSEISSQNSWKLITNGICQMPLIETDTHFIAVFNWDKYEFHKLKSLPNVTGYFRKVEQGDPVLEKIEVQYRKTLNASTDPNDFESKMTFLETEMNFTEEGIKRFNSCAHLFGQLRAHLSLHSWAARLAQLQHDHLHGTHLGKFLDEFFKKTRIITNTIGDIAVTGDQGVFFTAAPSVGATENILDEGSNSSASSKFNPFDYLYTKQLTPSHHYAVLDTKYHESYVRGASNFVNNDWKQINDEWAITFPFFKKLRKTSPVYKKYNFAANPVAPSETDKLRLSQFLGLIAHNTTFGHSFIHESQYMTTDLAPNILDQNAYSIAPENYGQGKYSGMTVESAMKVARVEHVFKHYPVEDNLLLENPNISRYIKDAVKKIVEFSIKHGFDPDKQLMSSISI